MKRTLLAWLPGLALLAFWEFASGRLVKTIYVSKPSDIAQRLYEVFASGEIWPHLEITAKELGLGYVLGVACGLAGGYALGRAPRLARVAEPYVMWFYGIPKIALAPLFIIWFGIGMWSKVALAAIMVFFLVFYNVYAGVRGVDRDLVALARVMGADERQLGRHVYLPASAPFVLLGMRMAIPYAVIGVIVGEFTSPTKGLGLFIHYASDTYDPAGVSGRRAQGRVRPGQRRGDAAVRGGVRRQRHRRAARPGLDLGAHRRRAALRLRRRKRVRDRLADRNAALDNATIRELNAEVERDKHEPNAIAAAFLRGKGLVK